MRTEFDILCGIWHAKKGNYILNFGSQNRFLSQLLNSIKIILNGIIMTDYFSNRQITEAYQKMYEWTSNTWDWRDEDERRKVDIHGFDLRNRTDFNRCMPRYFDYQDDPDDEYWHAQYMKFCHCLDAMDSHAQIHDYGDRLSAEIPATTFSLDRVLNEYKKLSNAAKKAGWSLGNTEDNVKEQYKTASQRKSGRVCIGIDDRDVVTMRKDGDATDDYLGESAEDASYLEQNFDKMEELKEELFDIFHRDTGIVLIRVGSDPSV